MTLVEFLLARIAEDEAVAREAASHPPIHSTRWQLSTVTVETIDGVTHRKPRGTVEARPARVLAECEAKRLIVEEHPIYRGDRIQPIDTSGRDFGCELCHRLDAIHADSLIEAVGYCDTLLALALPYADHPDYDPEWSVS